MKKLSILGVLLALLLIVVMVVPAQAAGATVQKITSTYTYSPDNGLTNINVEEIWRIVIATTIDGTGASHIAMRISVTGTGFNVDTGEKYVVTGGTFMNIYETGDYPLVENAVYNNYLIGNGDATDYKVSGTFHFIMNANGEIVVDIGEPPV